MASALAWSKLAYMIRFFGAPAASALALLAFALMLLPLLEVANQSAFASVLGSAVITGVAAGSGAVLLSKKGVLRARPATGFSAVPLGYLAVIACLWTPVLVAANTGSYFLFAVALLALWLLPAVAGTLTALILTAFSVAGQIFHHGFIPGALIGPAFALAILIGFMLLLRAALTESDAKSLALQQLQATQEQLASAERETAVFRERARLARDLHDTVAQSLSSIKLLLQLAKQQPENAAATLDLAQQAAASALIETREFIAQLSDREHLTTANLTAALEQVVARAAKYAQTLAKTGTATVYSCDIAPSLPPVSAQLATMLVRATQASLENVQQHAAADQCSVRLSLEDEQLLLTISDNGVGFDYAAQTQQKPVPEHGFGLEFLRERVAECGGILTVTTAAGQGTVISIKVPLNFGEKS